MKKIENFIKRNLHYFKGIFIVSVLVIITLELGNLAKNLNFQQLGEILRDIPWWQIALLALIGFISEVPEIGYDLLLSRMLERKQKKSYLIQTSWITNTINNLVGFGGLISIGLRSTFYRNKKDGKEFANALSKVFLFSLSGLSFFSLISLLLVLLGIPNPYVQQYWIWLVGGALYFPLIFFVTRRKKASLLGGLSLHFSLKLLLVSVLEWCGVLLSFLSVGFALKVPISIVDVLPLFIAASVIGIVSMMPGSIGSFDLMMVLGLSAFHVPKEVIVAWLLLYRVFYYILPFLLGVILFLRNLGGNFNERFAGLPKDLTEEVTHKVLTFLLYFSGIMLILSGTIPQAFDRYSFLRRINPFSYHFMSQMLLLILGYFLILVGRGIAARVKRTYPLAIVLIVATMGYTLLRDFSWGILLFLGLLLIFVIFSKNELYREQLVYSWEMKFIDYFILGALTLLYIFIGIYNRPTFHRHNRLPSFFVFPSEKIWLMGFIGILIVSFLMVLLIHYLSLPQKTIGLPLNEKRVQDFLEKNGGNTDSQLVFLGDKEVYFYTQDDEDLVLFQFRIYNDKLMIMGDPSGGKEFFQDAISDLMKKADLLGYKLVFYEVSEEFIMILHDYGYDFIKMGEAAEVSLPDFSMSGKKRKAERALLNRFTREAYTFKVLQPPFSPEMMTRLKEVSDDWLGGRLEKGFSLGFFNESYLQKGPIAAVYNADNRLVAFANIIPSYSEKVGTIDLMRYEKSVENGVMDYLFIQLFQYMKEEGLECFDLGMAPLANVGTSRSSFFQERIAFLVFHFGSRLYSFQGLKEYKEKYASYWKPRYTLYSRDSSLIFTMIQLLIVDDTPVLKEKETLLHKFLHR